MIIDEDFEFFWEGRRYTADDIEHDWDIEFDSDEIAKLKALREIDGRSCECATIMKTRSGEFFIGWTEMHPEMLRFDDYFEEEAKEEIDRCGLVKRTESRLEEYKALVEAMPATDYVEEISRAEAFAAIVTLWMPEEFHGDCGLKTSAAS